MISKLTINNFKCFDQQAILLQPLTLLSGLNGMGKSSVIQSLLLLRQSALQGTLQDRGLMLNGDLVQLGTGLDVLFEGAEKEEISLGIETREGSSGSWRFAVESSSDILRTLDGQVRGGLFDEGLFGKGFEYITAERIGPRNSFEMSEWEVGQNRCVGSRGEYTAHFLGMYGTEKLACEALAHDKAPSHQLLHQVEAWMGEICPGTRVHIAAHADMRLMSLQYSFVAGKQESNRFRSGNVGFGITYTLPVLVAILAADRGSLLLLENPEAHLHPRGQAQLGRLVALAASSGVQIVLESHSDHILNGIRVAAKQGCICPDDIALHFFERDEAEGQIVSHIKSPRIDEDGRLDMWPDGFFDEWDKSLEALL